MVDIPVLLIDACCPLLTHETIFNRQNRTGRVSSAGTGSQGQVLLSYADIRNVPVHLLGHVIYVSSKSLRSPFISLTIPNVTGSRSRKTYQIRTYQQVAVH